MMNTGIMPLEGQRLYTAENRSYISSREGLECAMNAGVTVESIATVCQSDMSVAVDLGAIRGVIPREEIAFSADGREIKDIAVITRVGKAVCFKVTGFEESPDGRFTALLSRRAAQLECLNSYLLDLCPGDVIPVRITHMEHFGAFADVGCGIVSLLPIDSISVSRISHPSDRFALGETISAVVKSVDYESGRLFLSHRELLGTWEENAAEFSAGQTVSGVVRSIEEYGVFVELAPNLAGLAEYSGSVSVGECVSVYIKSIIPDKMKIKLVLINTYTDEAPPRSIRYFLCYPRTQHISYWRYSPASCPRVIESVF